MFGFGHHDKPTKTKDDLSIPRWKQLVSIGSAGLLLAACNPDKQAATQPTPDTEVTIAVESSVPTSIETLESGNISISPETTAPTTPETTNPTTSAPSVPEVTASPSESTVTSSVSTPETTPSAEPSVTVALPERSKEDDTESARIHDSSAYKALSSEQKAAFDQADKATFAELSHLSPADLALYTYIYTQGSYDDFNGDALGASHIYQIDKSSFLEHTWPEAMSASPQRLSENKSGPSEYIGVVIADALIKASHHSGETAAKLIGALFVEAKDPATLAVRDKLLTVIGQLDRGDPAAPIIDGEYIDYDFLAQNAMLDDRYATDGKLDGGTYTVNTRPEKGSSNIQLTLKYYPFQADDTPYHAWSIAKVTSPGNPDFDQALAK